MAKYWKIVHRGTFSGIGEIFNHGHHFETVDTVDMAAVLALVPSWRTAVFTATYLGQYHTTVSWSQADVYQINITDGTALDHGVVTGAFAGTVTGSSVMPTEVAMVLSLRTSVLLRRGRGRMYLPPPAVSTLDATAQWVSATRTAIADAWQDYFQAIYSSTGFTPAVRGLSTPGPGYVMRAITSIDVGSVPDAQRRRRNRIAETRTSRSLP